MAVIESVKDLAAMSAMILMAAVVFLVTRPPKGPHDES